MKQRLSHAINANIRALETQDPARFRTVKANKYGLTDNEYNELWRKQEGRCAICASYCSRGGTLCIDHNHQTGEVRGLLCHKCNTAIGLMDDSIDNLQAAIIYLQAL